MSHTCATCGRSLPTTEAWAIHVRIVPAGAALVKIEIDGLPPSVNHTYFTDQRGRRLLSTEAKTYLEATMWITMESRRQASWEWNGNWLRLFIKCYMPDKRRRDVHNLTKVLLDGISDGLGVDDSWFLVHDEIPEMDKKHPRVLITIFELTS